MLPGDVSVPGSDPIGDRTPPDSRFVRGGPAAARPEIWGVGLRNPWRYSFDEPARGGTGALIIGDVGQDAWEEVNYEPPGHGGRNYGWPLREGRHDYDPRRPLAFGPLTEPIHDYGHGPDASITGGYIYR